MHIWPPSFQANKQTHGGDHTASAEKYFHMGGNSYQTLACCRNVFLFWGLILENLLQFVRLLPIPASTVLFLELSP